MASLPQHTRRRQRLRAASGSPWPLPLQKPCALSLGGAFVLQLAHRIETFMRGGPFRTLRESRGRRAGLCGPAPCRRGRRDRRERRGDRHRPREGGVGQSGPKPASRARAGGGRSRPGTGGERPSSGGHGAQDGIGANARPALRKGLAFCARFVKAEIHPTDWTTAEVVKTAENAYWDVQIAFANEVALISEELGVDAYRVRELVNTCPYRMMLIPGAGVGGHCIPKDSWLLVSPAVQSKPELIPTAREVNDFMPRRMARLVEEALAAAGRKIKGARVAVLGFSYRENTDDTRNSPAKTMIQELRRRGADISIHDPFARSERGYAVLRDVKAATQGADCVALVTAHDAYRKLDLKALGRRMRHLALVDGRNLYAGPDVVKMGFVYRGIGKGQF